MVGCGTAEPPAAPGSWDYGLADQPASRVDSKLFYIDIAFRQQKLAIEIDGRLHETDEKLFESDRWRQNALVAKGWRVLRFTWAMLRDCPDVFVSAVLNALH